MVKALVWNCQLGGHLGGLACLVSFVMHHARRFVLGRILVLSDSHICGCGDFSSPFVMHVMHIMQRQCPSYADGGAGEFEQKETKETEGGHQQMRESVALPFSSF